LVSVAVSDLVAKTRSQMRTLALDVAEESFSIEQNTALKTEVVRKSYKGGGQW
jgi:hypothetical protein